MWEKQNHELQLVLRPVNKHASNSSFPITNREIVFDGSGGGGGWLLELLELLVVVPVVLLFVSAPDTTWCNNKPGVRRTAPGPRC